MWIRGIPIIHILLEFDAGLMELVLTLEELKDLGELKNQEFQLMWHPEVSISFSHGTRRGLLPTAKVNSSNTRRGWGWGGRFSNMFCVMCPIQHMGTLILNNYSLLSEIQLELGGLSFIWPPYLYIIDTVTHY